MRSSRSRIIGSTAIPAWIRSRSAAPWSATSASPGTVEGGSTLTQQLARTLFLSNQKTYGRKVREAVLALMIDAQLSKEQVLELYLNRIYLSAGVYGVETMSRHLFGKPAKHLTLAESALVAGLARAPSALSPWSNLDGAIARSHVVLARMREEGFITEAQEHAARAPRIRIRPYPGATDPRGGYAKEFLRQQFRDRFGGDHPPDWEVQTTFVPELQDAGRARRRGRAARGSTTAAPGRARRDRPGNGDILALVGGRDFRQSQFNRAARSRRQPGSAFKPLLFAAALEHGFSPVSVLDGLANIHAAGPGRVGAAQRRRRDAGRADAAGRAHRVQQPRGDGAAAAPGIAAGAAGSRRTPGCATCPMCRRSRSAPAW